MDSAALRAHVESALRGRIASPFAYRQERPAPSTIASGIAELDRVLGGVPRGAMTEICGRQSSGRTTLLVSVLGSVARNGEVYALVDGNDVLDPQSLRTAGIDPKSLLWVRCHSLEQALRAADLLLQGGGFGLVAVDLAGLPSSLVRRIPLSTWFRFRRAVENTPTALVVLEQEPTAKPCASLVLDLERSAAHWSTAYRSGNSGQLSGRSKIRGRELTHTVVLGGASLKAQISHSRLPVCSAAQACFNSRARWRAGQALWRNDS